MILDELVNHFLGDIGIGGCFYLLSKVNDGNQDEMVTIGYLKSDGANHIYSLHRERLLHSHRVKVYR